jgi:putative transposase
MNSVNLVSANHAVGGWNFHFVFTPAYRRKVFEDEVVKEVCEREARRVAGVLGIEIVASAFGPDHWHLFIAYCKNYSAPQLAFRFKGAVSHAVRAEAFDRVRKWLWGNHFWSHGYFAETIGRVTSKTITHYITTSQGKHWKKRPPQNQTTLTAY